MFCAGRVVEDDLKRTQKACGGSILTTVADLNDTTLGTCATFEETQVGGERYNLFRGCPKAKTCTIVLRGGAQQFMDETERSLHDAIMIVRRAVKNDAVVAGTYFHPPCVRLVLISRSVFKSLIYHLCISRWRCHRDEFVQVLA